VPTIGKRQIPVEPPSEPEFREEAWDEPERDFRYEALAEFRAGFQRSKRGNLWRTWEGKTLTVFRRRGDVFAWCIATDDAARPRWAARNYHSEEDALHALAEALEVI